MPENITVCCCPKCGREHIQGDADNDVKSKLDKLWAEVQDT